MSGRRALGSAVAAAATMIVAALLPFRGINLWGLWLVESAERYTAWRTEGSEALRGAFVDPNALGPLGPWMASLLGAGDPLFGARFGACLAAGLAAAVVFWWSERRGGLLGAMVALGALWLQPRFWSAATVPGPTIWALVGVLILWRVTLAARADVRWSAPAIVLGAVGLASGFPAVTLLLPLAWLVLVQPFSMRSGLVSIRRVGLWTLMLPALWVGLLIAVIPWLHVDSGERLVAMFGAWIQRPPEPFLVAGRWWGPTRMWPWTPVQLLFATTPLALMITALGALGRSTAVSADARQETVVFTVWALGLPVCLRSVFHGGIDLMIFPVVALAIAVGATVSRLAGAYRARRGSVPLGVAALAAALLAVSAADVVRSGGVWEAYRSSALGGAPGAAVRGYSRYPHGPVPIEPLVAAGAAGTRRFAVLANDWEIRPVFEWYRRRGLLPSDVSLVPIGEAEAVMLSLDDALPEFYGVAQDWTMFARTSPGQVDMTQVQGIVVFAVGLLR